MSWFNLFEKKRGDRRTGSQAVYTVGEAVVLLVVFLVGFIGLAAVIAAQTLLSTAEHWLLSGWQFGLILLVLGSMVIFGGWLLVRTIWRSTSTREYQAALENQASKLAPFGSQPPEGAERPTIPHTPLLTDSPGVVLKFRLPVSQRENWRLLAAAVFAPLWGAANAWMIVLAIQNAQAGLFDWLLLGCLVPFSVVTIVALTFLFRQFLFYTSIGPTAVEVNHLPMQPGGMYQVFVTQAGRMLAKRLKIMLLCEEEAQFHQGTDIRKEVREVYRHVLFSEKNVEIVPEESFEQTCDLEIPADCMHSFESGSNSVCWRICILVDFVRQRGFRRTFPLVVVPQTVRS